MYLILENVGLGKAPATFERPPVIDPGEPLIATQLPGKPPVYERPIIQPPIPRPPIIQPPIPPRERPGADMYRFEGKYAYPLTAEAARTRPAALTAAPGFMWTKWIRPLEKYGFAWEWRFVPSPEQLVSAGPIVAAPLPPQANVVDVQQNKPNILPPAGDPNRLRIDPNEQAAQYYNIVTGEVTLGRRVFGTFHQQYKGPGWELGGQWYSLPPDDSGNWLIRAEAVRQGYISMTGQAGVQINRRLPEAYGAEASLSIRAPEKTIFGLSPLTIGGILLAAKFILGSKR